VPSRRSSPSAAAITLGPSSTGGASGPGGSVRLAGIHSSPLLRPATLEAITTASRGGAPAPRSQPPMMRLVAPAVSRRGATG
jgi:hypothetical protein